MHLADYFKLVVSAVSDNKIRSFLTTLGIAIGIAAVVLLTSIGEGVNQFVVAQFTQFGTTIVQIQPGKTTTMGASVGVINTTRPLSIDDSIALSRLPHIESVVAFVVGNSEVEGNQRQRRANIYGTDSGFPQAFSFDVALGNFLPDDNPHQPRATAVLGSKMRDELFGETNPLGQFVRVGGSRFRVVGVMASKGQMLGFDLDDTVYVPTGRAMELFNRNSLMEVDLTYNDNIAAEEIISSVQNLLIARHGSDDVTITSQQQMMDVLDSILGVLTSAVAGLGAISIIVGGIGILTVMIIAVRERINEVGLLRALGASRKQILALFLGEAVLLACIGGLCGLLFGLGGAQLLHLAIPALPVETSLFYIVLSVAVAIVVGVFAGVLPARGAAKMLPVDALRAE